MGEQTDADVEDTLDGDLSPAMPTNSPTGSFADFPAPEARAGDMHAGRYRLEQLLATRGGTSTWRAFDQKLSRSVLVHLLGAHDPRSTDVLDAARKAATATDSRFLRVLDAVSPADEEEPSLVVCEFAPGESLEKLLRQGPLSALEAAWIARELADAMSQMHGEGLFHQRLNPDTVIITATGSVKIVGFLIEAAMHPDADEGTLAWSERERADVQAIGKLLYACLVNRWPTAESQLLDDRGEPVHPWGMPAAPFDNRGWLTPRQVRSGVSPALDVVCDQILSAAPRQNEVPLRTANEVMLALNKVLGTADASPDLERRLRFPVQSMDSASESTGRMPAIDAAVPAADTAITALQTPVPAPRPSAPSSQPTPPAPGDTVLRGSSIARPRPRPRNRRWLVILLAITLLVLVASLLRAVWREAGTRVSGPGQAETQVYQPTKVDDFDPPADGGNAEENPNQVKNAWDGKPATAWQTLVYLNDPKFGKLKPGVGLVVDLGQKVEVGRVKVGIEGKATGLQLRVPKNLDAEQAPSKSQSEWTTVAQNAAATGTVELAPKASVQTRYVLVYVTNLPSVGGNKYRAGITEITIER